MRCGAILNKKNGPNEQEQKNPTSIVQRVAFAPQKSNKPAKEILGLKLHNARREGSHT